MRLTDPWKFTAEQKFPRFPVNVVESMRRFESSATTTPAEYERLPLSVKVDERMVLAVEEEIFKIALNIVHAEKVLSYMMKTSEEITAIRLEKFICPVEAVSCVSRSS